MSSPRAASIRPRSSRAGRAAWAEAGVGHADPGSDRPPYAIAIPPPNVTGALHMGHALNNTIQDVLIRSHRMAGDESGVDLRHRPRRHRHPGGGGEGARRRGRLAPGARPRGVRAPRLGVEGGVRRQHHRPAQAPGLHARLRARALHDGRRLRRARCSTSSWTCTTRATSTATATWSTGTRACGSAISDLEVEDREVTDTLVRIAYPLADGSGEVVVATVRPETMLGDTAVAVNPDDERYRDLIGRTRHAAADRPRDPDRRRRARPARTFGTGALKVTPAHDPNDFEIARRHGLPAVGVIGEDGRMTARRRRALRRPRRRRSARARDGRPARAGPAPGRGALHPHGPVLAPLGRPRRAAGLAAVVLRHDAPRRRRRSRRSRRGGCASRPPSGASVYLDWMREIRPWCISRQLWWGHQIPVWYRGEEVHVGRRGAPKGDGLGARPRRPRHLVQLGAVALRHPRAGRSARPSSSASTRRRCSRRPATSSSCGSPAW